MVIFDQQLPPKQFLTLLTLIILAVSIPVVVYLVKTEQIFKSKAAEGTKIEFVDSGGNPITATTNRNVKLNLTYQLPLSNPTSFEFIKTAFAQVGFPGKATNGCCTGIPRNLKIPGIGPIHVTCPTAATYGPSGNVIVDSDNAPLDGATCQTKYGVGCDCASSCTTTQEDEHCGSDDRCGTFTRYHCQVSCSASSTSPSSSSFNIDAKPDCNITDGTYQGYIKIDGWPQTSTVTLFRRQVNTNENFVAVATLGGSPEPICANPALYDSPDVGGFPYEYYATDSSGQSSNLVTVSNICSKLATLGGIVFLDKNKNGIQDSGELGFKDATVVAKHLASGKETAMSTNRTGYAVGSFSSTESIVAYGHQLIIPGKDAPLGIDQGDYQVTVTLPQGYTVTNPNILSFYMDQNGKNLNIGVVPPPSYPTHFRVANDQASLASIPNGQPFTPPSQTIPWVLPAGLGEKTVYAQFKVDNVWGPVLSAQINLIAPAASSSPTASSPSPSVGQIISSPSPLASCIPRPACLDNNPACAIAEPAQGWCPTTLSSPSPAVSAAPSPVTIILPGSGSSPSPSPASNLVERVTNPITEFIGQLFGGQSQTPPPPPPPPQPPSSGIQTGGAQNTRTAASSTPSSRASQAAIISRFDLNSDSKLNAADVAVLLNDWRRNKKTSKADFNRDGVINSFDYSLLRANL